MNHRQEKDSLGSKKIPSQAYYGVQTARALENFPISGWTAHPGFLEATILVKKAAALVNAQLGLIPPKLSKTIARVCDEILKGKWRDQFVVDVFQAGAGTSHNMNVNEVIANRANEILGTARGTYSPIHPNDHVNRCQSTNDMIPTAIRLAALQELQKFLPTLTQLIQIFKKKSKQLNSVIKSGRTHLQDATPIRLGQEFSGYTQCLENHLQRIQATKKDLLKIGLGGTAVGTGMNTHPQYRKKIAQKLSQLSGEKLVPASNFFEAMQSLAPFTHLSGTLRNLTLDLIRIANDLRLLASGPRTGLAEIQLPAVQPGSSIMPGKVNPSIAEMLNMTCFFVLGLDESIKLASQAGQLELNVMMPLVAYSLPWSVTLLTNALKIFGERCVEGIQADNERCLFYAENSTSIATALAPKLGYAKTAELIKEAIRSKKNVRAILIEQHILSPEEIEELFHLLPLTEVTGSV
ncbi:MAG: aspartate ammonia-lyase [Deltaproteobacteria bacterium]|nr:aspartate ammonia-lyase [Deltaproteobacteria bacterium]